MGTLCTNAGRKLEYDFYNFYTPRPVVSCSLRGFGRLECDSDSPQCSATLLDVVYPQLKVRGVIQYGSGSKFDDRKYRLNGVETFFDPKKEASCRENHIHISLGVTTYPEVCADILRSPAENLMRRARGSKRFDDEWIHFARSLGCAFVPVTLDGSVFLGKRDSTLYHGYLNAAAGNVPFHGIPYFDRFYDQAISELREEFGRDLQLVGEARFAGIATNGHGGDADCVWVGRINVHDSYFLTGQWKSARVDSEHDTELIRVSSVQDRDFLLEMQILFGRKFEGVMGSTALGLDYLTDADFLPL